MVRVIEATRASALAEAEQPFVLAEGARARLVMPALSDRLRVALLPWRDTLAAALGELGEIALVREGEPADAFVGGNDEVCWVGDELHGDQERGWLEPPFVRVATADIGRIQAALLAVRA